MPGRSERIPGNRHPSALMPTPTDFERIRHASTQNTSVRDRRVAGPGRCSPGRRGDRLEPARHRNHCRRAHRNAAGQSHGGLGADRGARQRACRHRQWHRQRDGQHAHCGAGSRGLCQPHHAAAARAVAGYNHRIGLRVCTGDASRRPAEGLWNPGG
ncbi:MAG: hypothetical protein ACK55I_01615 [bacterium]